MLTQPADVNVMDTTPQERTLSSHRSPPGHQHSQAATRAAVRSALPTPAPWAVREESGGRCAQRCPWRQACPLEVRAVVGATLAAFSWGTKAWEHL